MHIDFNGLTFCAHTFGCQMNKNDSEHVCGMLESYGAIQVDSIEEADIVIFMTCCVREAADTRLYGQVSSIKNLPLRENSTISNRIIAIGGCIGQRDGQKLIDSMPHVSVVFGTHNLHSLPGLIMSALQNRKSQCEIFESSEQFTSDLPLVREHNWAAWLPITIGCNNFCTYCIVPYVRGREKSRPLEDIVAEAKRYVQDGVKEITLLGQNVNSYGRDLYGAPRFVDVLYSVADTGIERIRFATSHPKDLTDEVIQAFGKIPSLMPALHLPVQSGSNRILEAMNRRYTHEHYKTLVYKLRNVVPDIALSTDIIVGFPGETEQDFLDTFSLVDEIGYKQVFTFIYSKRAGTPAATYLQNSTSAEIQDRFDRLVDLVQKRAFELNQPYSGEKLEILVEGCSKRDDTVVSGRSAFNQTVHAPLPYNMSLDSLIGNFVTVQVKQAKTWYLSGEIIPSSLRS